MSTAAGTITKQKAILQYMDMGTVYTVQLSAYPILDAKGQDTGAIDDRIVNFNEQGRLMFTTEVSTAVAVNANGEYHINYADGILTCQPAVAGYAKMWWQTKEVLP